MPHGAGYELLIQKFLSLYGDQIDIHRKFVVQLFAEEWSQYIDLPKGFVVSERCKVRLVPLQIQVRASSAPTAATGVGGRPCPATAALPGRVEPPPCPLPVARARATGAGSRQRNGDGAAKSSSGSERGERCRGAAGAVRQPQPPGHGGAERAAPRW